MWREFASRQQHDRGDVKVILYKIIHFQENERKISKKLGVRGGGGYRMIRRNINRYLHCTKSWCYQARLIDEGVLCEYVIMVHTKLPCTQPGPVILWIELGWRPTWLPSTLYTMTLWAQAQVHEPGPRVSCRPVYRKIAIKRPGTTLFQLLQSDRR